MRFTSTKLEIALANLPPEERTQRLTALWRSFRDSEHFDLVVAILRDLERQAMMTIRERPMADLRGAAMALHVVDRIRRSFEALDAGDAHDAVRWSDEEGDFTAEEKEYI